MLFDRRLRAYSIDTSLAFLLVLIVTFIIYDFKISYSIKYSIVAAIYLGVYIIPNLISPGQTFGKRVQKLKVIKNRGYEGKEYQVPSRFLLVLRELRKAAFTIFTFGFYLIIAGIVSNNRSDGRSIHDFIFGTRVIALTRYSDERTERFVGEEMKATLKGTSYYD